MLLAAQHLTFRRRRGVAGAEAEGGLAVEVSVHRRDEALLVECQVWCAQLLHLGHLHIGWHDVAAGAFGARGHAVVSVGKLRAYVREDAVVDIVEVEAIAVLQTEQVVVHQVVVLAGDLVPALLVEKLQAARGLVLEIDLLGHNDMLAAVPLVALLDLAAT